MFEVDSYTRSIIDRTIKAGNARPRAIIEVDRLSYTPTGIPPQEIFELQQSIPTAFTLDYVVSGSSTTTSPHTSECDYPDFPIEGMTVGQATVADAFGSKEEWRLRAHQGVDFAVPSGSTVIAAWSGIVTHVGSDGAGGGIYVDVYHGGGLKTRYSHLTQASVNIGQQVKKGQKLGITGAVGLMGESDFHFEVQKNAPSGFGPQQDGTPVNPTPYLQNSVCARSVNVTVSGDSDLTASEELDGKAIAFYAENFNTHNPIGDGDATTMYDDYGHYVSSVAPIPFQYGTINGKKCADAVCTASNRASYDGTHATLQVEVNYSGDGFFDFSFATNLAEGEVLTAYIDGQTVWSYDQLGGNFAWQSGRLTVKGAGKHVFWFVWNSVGKVGAGVALEGFIASYLNPADVLTGTSLTLNEILFNYRNTQPNQQSIGSFTYVGTFFLEDDVISVEIDRSDSFGAQQATIVLDNSSGQYTPYYSPQAFSSSLITNSPWIMNINGNYYGVISDNTPIRIYLAYGHDAKVRMYTGRVSQVQEMADTQQVQITCLSMYDKANNREIYVDRVYPPVDSADSPNAPWLVSAVVEDLLNYAGLVGWRQNPHEQQYPDFIIPDTTVLEEVPMTGQFIKANGDYQLALVDASDYTLATPGGYLNPFVFLGGYTIQKGTSVGDAITTALQNTNYLIGDNRYGTIVVYEVPYNAPVVKKISTDDVIQTLQVTEDYSSNCRNHLIVTDGTTYDNFIDADLLGATKNELLTAGVTVEWAISSARRQTVADRMFYDIKRLCRTIRIEVIGDPTLDVFDTIEVSDDTSALKQVYTIKAITDRITQDQSYIQTIDLMWQ